MCQAQAQSSNPASTGFVSVSSSDPPVRRWRDVLRPRAEAPLGRTPRAGHAPGPLRPLRRGPNPPPRAQSPLPLCCANARLRRRSSPFLPQAQPSAGPSFAEVAAAEAPRVVGSFFETLARAATATVAKLKAPEEQKRREEALRLKLKSDMLLAIAPLDRGAAAPPDKRAAVEAIARQLEARGGPVPSIRNLPDSPTAPVPPPLSPPRPPAP